MSLLTKIDSNKWNIYQQAERKKTPEAFHSFSLRVLSVSDAGACIVRLPVFVYVSARPQMFLGQSKEILRHLLHVYTTTVAKYSNFLCV